MICRNVAYTFPACIRKLVKKYGNGLPLLWSKIRTLMQEIRQNKNSPQPNRITFRQGEGKGRNERKFARFLHENRPRVMQPRKCLQGKSREQRRPTKDQRRPEIFQLVLPVTVLPLVGRRLRCDDESPSLARSPETEGDFGVCRQL